VDFPSAADLAVGRAPNSVASFTFAGVDAEEVKTFSGILFISRSTSERKTMDFSFLSPLWLSLDVEDEEESRGGNEGETDSSESLAASASKSAMYILYGVSSTSIAGGGDRGGGGTGGTESVFHVEESWRFGTDLRLVTLC